MGILGSRSRLLQGVAGLSVALLTLAGASAASSASPPPARPAPMAQGGGTSSTGNSFEAVTCASASSCVAVGQLGVPHGGVPLIDVESAGVWTYANAPVPSDASSASPNDELDAVSCAATSSCVAVGYYADTVAGTTYQQALIDVKSGGAWAAVTVPLPGNASSMPQNAFDAVSCPTAGNCVAVGSYLDTAGNQQALLDVEVGGTWSSAAVPLPGGADTLNPGNTLDSVRCTSSGDCVAVGSYVNTSPSSTCTNKDCLQALIDVATSGTWSAVTAPLPAGATTSPQSGNSLASVTCTSVTDCTAVGSYVDTAASSRPLVDVEASGAWTAVTVPLPGDASSTPNTDAFTAISCVSVGDCVAVGQYDNAQENPEGLIGTESGGTWTSATAPVPSDANLALPDVLLSSVSCSTLTSCVAVGSYEIPPVRNLSPDALLVAEVGGVWMAGTVDLPGDASTTQPYSAMIGVTCTSPWSCVAVGLYVDSAGRYQVILDTLGVSLTTLPTVPGPPNTVVAIVGHGQASVGWIAPSSNGGAPITSYTVTASPGGASCTTSGALRCRIWPLHGEATYSFTVVAANKVGTSAPSTSSAPVRTQPIVDATATIGSFAPLSFQLTQSLRNEIIVLARTIVTNGDARISLVGYSDTTGSATQIKVVSRQRAQVVAAALRSDLSALHVSGMTITLSARGAADPVASNKTPAGRAKNRRVIATLS